MTEVDQIRQQMAQIRLNLHQDMTHVVVGAGAVLDWRKYIAKAPWVAVGLAFAAGYWVVPRKKKEAVPPGKVDARPVIQIAPRVEQPRTKEKQKSTSPVGAVLGFAWPIVANLAQSYALRFVQNALIGQEMRSQSTAGPASAWGPPEQPAHTGGASNPHNVWGS